jgi:prepilin-type N-terminal cleavage/methylation domain-containing protein
MFFTFYKWRCFSMNETKNEQGFSMVELLVAMVLVGTLLVAVMMGFAQAVASTGKVRNHTIALNLAKERLDFLKQYERDTANLRGTGVWGNASYSRNFNNITYTISNINITAYQPTLTDIIPMRVTVGWTEKGRTRSVSVETIYYLHEL